MQIKSKQVICARHLMKWHKHGAFTNVSFQLKTHNE
jgi:hypothetical protein